MTDEASPRRAAAEPQAAQELLPPPQEWIANETFTTTASTSAVVSAGTAVPTVLVNRSTDDGRTWHKVSSPIAGQGGATGQATFNNDQGPIVADANSDYVYDVYAAGTQQSKSHSADFNNVFVSRSTDGGKHWETNLVHSAPVGTALNNIFPSMTVDQTTGTVYAVWTDSHSVWVSNSTDHGKTWGAPVDVSTGPTGLATTLMPWVAARDGKVDVVFYGSTGAQNSSTSVWNVYDWELQ